MIEDTLEIDFLNILCNHPQLMKLVQAIWKFEKPFSSTIMNEIWGLMKDQYVKTGTIVGRKIHRSVRQMYPNLQGNPVGDVTKPGAFPEQLQDCLTEVRSRMIIRELHGVSHQILHADMTSDGMKVLGMATQKIRSIESGMTFESEVSIPEAVIKVRDKAERSILPKSYDDYMPTGFNGLDRFIMGLELGKMFVIGARPSIGKTGMALSMLGNLELIGIRSALFSCEMDVESLIQRRIQQKSTVSLREIKNSKKQSLLDKFKINCDNYEETSNSIFKCLSNDRRLSNLKLQMRKVKDEFPDVKVMMIDYYQKIRPDKRGHDKVSELEDISGDIYDMAKELNVAVVLLAQLNRTAEANERPKMSQLKGAGALEQDADVIVLIHRERKASFQDNDEEPIHTEFIIVKARDSKTGIATSKFIGKTTHFVDKVDSHYEDELPL